MKKFKATFLFCFVLITLQTASLAALNEDAMSRIRMLKEKLGQTGQVVAAEASDQQSRSISANETNIETKGDEEIFELVSNFDIQAKRKVTSHLQHFPGSFKIKNSKGETPLHLAARWSKPEIVSILIEAGADVNAIDDNGHSILDFAARENIELLQKRGAKYKFVKETLKVGPVQSNLSYNSGRPKNNYSVNVGPRGGIFHYSKNGKKVYHKKR